jgi:hypothetical protein
LQEDVHAEGHDASFLVESLFSQDSGIKPRAVYRNLSPAELYEKVREQLERFYWVIKRPLCARVVVMSVLDPESSKTHSNVLLVVRRHLSMSQGRMLCRVARWQQPAARRQVNRRIAVLAACLLSAAPLQLHTQHCPALASLLPVD